MEKPFVLVADDNEATCTLITALLRTDFAVDTAGDGMEAIAKLKHRRYAVILLDLRMPLVDGYAVLEYLRMQQSEMMSRVLVVTASLAPREMARVKEYPICKLIAKPFEVDQLLAEAKRCAGQHNGDSDVRGPILTTGMLLFLADLLRQRLM